MYLLHKATAWHQRFPPVPSPDSMDDTKKVLEKDHEGPTGAGVDHDNVDDEFCALVYHADKTRRISKLNAMPFS